MAQYYHLPLYKSTYDLLLELMIVTKEFPKDFKFSIGEKIQNHIIELLIDIYRANSARIKKNDILSILEHVQFLNMFLKISFDLKIITQLKYANYIEQTYSIAKQANGWLQAIQSKEPEPDCAKVQQGVLN